LGNIDDIARTGFLSITGDAQRREENMAAMIAYLEPE
jgi:hypothetical protein